MYARKEAIGVAVLGACALAWADAPAGTASARSYFTVFQARPELPLQAIIAGRYQDRFTRRNGVWSFAERVIVIELVGDLRCHLKPEILALLGH